MPVEVVHFNPRRRPKGPLGRWRPKRPLNNFGDLLGPLLVERILTERGLEQPREHRRLATIGSIMRLTAPGDVIWGSGVNGKSMDIGGAPRIDVRSVRGPRTRALLESVGTACPEIYGDPGLLWSTYWPRESYLDPGLGPDREFSVVPNHNEYRPTPAVEYINPLGSVHDIIGRIARSEFVCGSSLHGIVIAEAFGIPARLIRSSVEPAFKYDDYYQGTGRETYEVASSVEEAREMGGEIPPVFSAERLLAAFPEDIYVPAPAGDATV